MPVLSVQMKLTEPSVSTAGSRRTKALRRAMARAPRASIIVITAGRASGMAATARLSAVSSMSRRRLPPPDAEGEEDGADRQYRDGELPPEYGKASLQRRLCRLDGFEQAGDPAELGRHAGRDRKTATAAVGNDGALERHVGLIGDRQPGIRRGSARFSAGMASPVSAASLILRRGASTRRRSAGTPLPASTSTTSPRTISAAAIACRGRPARRRLSEQRAA